MKESKVKGKAFLPSYVIRNTLVRSEFKNTDRRTKHGQRKAIKLSKISPAMRERVGKVRPGVKM